MLVAQAPASALLSPNDGNFILALFARMVAILPKRALRMERPQEQNVAAATRFFEKAMRHNSEPEIVTMDKGGANKAAIDAINTRREFARPKYALLRLMRQNRRIQYELR
jgi:hypothetical protein